MDDLDREIQRFTELMTDICTTADGIIAMANQELQELKALQEQL